MTTRPTNVERTIGRMETAIETQGKQLDQIMALMREQEQRGTDGRARLYDKIDEQGQVINSVDKRLSEAEGTLKKVEPLATEFGKLRERSRGFVFAMMLAWTLFGGFLMWVGGIAWDWLIARLTTG